MAAGDKLNAAWQEYATAAVLDDEERRRKASADLLAAQTRWRSLTKTLEAA
jgi:hypothetical protein